MVTISVDVGDDLLLRLLSLAMAVDGFDGNDDVRELLWVMDILNVGDDLGDGDVIDNRDPYVGGDLGGRWR